MLHNIYTWVIMLNVNVNVNKDLPKPPIILIIDNKSL